MLKTSIILLSISALSKGVCDKLKFQPDSFIFKTDWWLERGDYAWNNRTFLEKYVFSFISGGWHCFDSLRITSLLLLIALLLTNDKEKIDPLLRVGDEASNRWFAVLLLVFLGYIIHGSIFELTYWIL